ncbi:acetoacetate decarboxylase family protein [Nocardia miyunensis]|uniref:acetoacetate decarboxylase family protein n=1 Tax=Nocardia miyunensis TaxID=282684 RepID=UPI00082D802E|nr:acetoacetate decarboxylase family protein [Nocardia miyunensis]
MPSTSQDTVEVILGTRTLSVPAGGLYDRYRMRTDLDDIARDPHVSSVDFFRNTPKTEVDSRIGKTLTPNFYYRISTARLVILARSRTIRARLPVELTPLEIAPGLGLASVMFFRYDVCDIDFYTEVGIGVAVRPARHRGPGLVDLLAGLSDDHLHSYVLSLPVSTQIAQVRGHDGYGFPKWVTDIDVQIDPGRTTARVAAADGRTDIAFSAPTPAQKAHRTGERVSTLTSYTRMDDAWHSTKSEINMLSGGSALLPRNIDLELGHGRLAEDLRSLNPIRTLRLDVMTEGQLALHMPVPTSVPSRK